MFSQCADMALFSVQSKLWDRDSIAKPLNKLDEGQQFTSSLITAILNSCFLLNCTVLVFNVEDHQQSTTGDETLISIIYCAGYHTLRISLHTSNIISLWCKPTTFSLKIALTAFSCKWLLSYLKIYVQIYIIKYNQFDYFLTIVNKPN